MISFLAMLVAWTVGTIAIAFPLFVGILRSIFWLFGIRDSPPKLNARNKNQNAKPLRSLARSNLATRPKTKPHGWNPPIDKLINTPKPRVHELRKNKRIGYSETLIKPAKLSENDLPQPRKNPRSKSPISEDDFDDLFKLF